ncbi:MAG: PEP/pyruvate-binding domain-containing protein [Bacteroidales bacterium]|nr:PEP/pyruvate-binding domain-containing protein [Bacteroidales bacterium]
MANLENRYPTLRETKFVDLMQKRVFNVLIVANPYDAFMLEDDGRVDEKIFDEYAKLGLRYPPRFMRAASKEDAERLIKGKSFDLVICMPGTDNNDVFDIARDIKNEFPLLPIVVLTPFSHGITRRMENEDLSTFDYVFCWLGNTELLLSIIKLIEDKMNLENDLAAGVQMILVVEDSIRFYSSLLPNLYQFVLQQSLEFATEALNSQLEMLRMRGRSKIVLARTYEEAWNLYSKYSDNVLGVISDCRFPMREDDAEKDELAGYKLLSAIRGVDEYVPLVLDSSETDKKPYADKCKAAFIDKNSKKLNQDIKDVLTKHFGFGDFIFRNPETMQEIGRVCNLKELQNKIFSLPADSLSYHLRHNNVSRWLSSRAIFPVAEFLKKITWKVESDVDAHRQYIFDAIVSYRKMKNRGVVAIFNRHRFDSYSQFARIGEGSLGGKGRGLAFLDNIIKRREDLNEYGNASVSIPKTVVLCTDIFDLFMENNALYEVALSDLPDEEILQYFLRGHLPESLMDDLMSFIDVVNGPLAIRSSSLLEDSHYQPFAGIYSTYMIPCAGDKYMRLNMLSNAIKGVYASVFYRASKDYMVATSNVIDQEKMAVILQEVVGQEYASGFYPTISGVGRSINYYPIGDEKADEGVVELALGLGKYIVDGGLCLRVCPHHPDKVLQTSEMEIALRETQTSFFALDTSPVDGAGQQGLQFQVDDAFNLKRVTVRDADKDGSLRWIVSTYDPYDQCIYDGYYEGKNRKIVSFSGVLQNDVFPLPELLRKVLDYGQKEMGRPVEIEFAVNLHDNKQGEFYLLQIRPMVDNQMELNEDLVKIPDEDCLIRSHSAIGHGVVSDIYDIVYVKTENYNASENTVIADEIEQINRGFLQRGENYVLVGPGRWGSSDSWLGIPVKWPNISAAKVIVEAGLRNFRVEPSQGTHFFQNLTSMGVGYFTVNDFIGDGVYNQKLLNSMSAVEETAHVRRVRFSAPIVMKIDGMKKEGVVLLPSVESAS